MGKYKIVVNEPENTKNYVTWNKQHIKSQIQIANERFANEFPNQIHKYENLEIDETENSKTIYTVNLKSNMTDQMFAIFKMVTTDLLAFDKYVKIYNNGVEYTSDNFNRDSAIYFARHRN